MFTIWNTETGCFASASSLRDKLGHAVGGAPVGGVEDCGDGGGVGESVCLRVSNLERRGMRRRKRDEPRVRRAIIPPTRSEPHNPAEMRFIRIEILLQCLRPNLHQHLHMNLRLLWIICHSTHQLLVFQSLADPHLPWRAPDLAI